MLPQLREVETRLADRVVVIGVHSAKFPQERGTDAVAQAVRRHHVTHPVVNDADFAVWQAFACRAWPTPAIARRLIGSLQFGEEARTVKQLIAAGGQSTAVANNQVMALVRTSINQVANTASQQVYEANQDITSKYRYVATLDSRTSSICQALDGREFEYGKGPMPPQHFNCLPGDALVLPGGRIAAVYRRSYEGFLYVIKTANGHVVRVTPNHPVLTGSGWQPAQGIKVGDQVFSSSLIPNKLIHQYNEGDAVTTAEEVFSAFGESTSVLAVEVPTTAPDFHGDAWSGAPGVDPAKQVAVVLADRELLLTVNPSLLKALHNRNFLLADSAGSSLSHLDERGLAIAHATFGSMGSSGQCLAFGGSSAIHAGKLLLAAVPELSTGFQDDALYGTWRDIELVGNATDTNSIVVSGNDQVDVTWVGREPFSGHVYNFETESGTYWANGILTHNCRSTTVPVIDYKRLGFPPPPEGTRAAAGGQVPAGMSYGEWLSKQSAAVQADALGAGKVPYFNRLAKQYGPKDAIAKLVRDDGSELTLAQLQKRYGPA